MQIAVLGSWVVCAYLHDHLATLCGMFLFELLLSTWMVIHSLMLYNYVASFTQCFFYELLAMHIFKILPLITKLLTMLTKSAVISSYQMILGLIL